MPKITERMALDYHEEGRPGKIEITPTKPYRSQLDLSLAYSPGVAFPCKEIEHNPSDAYRYTNKGNLVAVISNGTAVLGLGDIGALAGKPVMEGKALLFKIFSGLDSFDIEINEKDPDKFVEIVKSISPTFGGINLEDIKSPECFDIERRLKEECDIPVMHDDQHGTAIISGSALLNALDIQNKQISEIKLVVNGAGAAAVSCTRLYVALGVDPKNIVMCDSHGVIRADRPDLKSPKSEFATTRDLHTLEEALCGADVFLGLSVANVVTQKMVQSMAPDPIVFALANPDPEISYEDAISSRQDIIMATGRSDYPNQINNVIGFPYIFRGALDCQASGINENMKIAAVHAIASLAKEPVPSLVDDAYDTASISFGRDYILPKALDPRLLTWVAPAVAKAAAESGIARKPITDFDSYREHLQKLMGDKGQLIRHITDQAARNPQKVVFTNGADDNVIKAAVRLAHDKICIPVLLGEINKIQKRAAEIHLTLDDIVLLDIRSQQNDDTRERYARLLSEMKARDGMTLQKARDLMWSRFWYGLMMLVTGDTDALIESTYSAANKSAQAAADIIGLREGYTHFATMHIVNTSKGTYFLADTAINPESDTSTIVDIARLSHNAVSFFGFKPVMAVLSYSNFGSNTDESEPRICADAVKRLHTEYPEISIDGEMQVNFAIDTPLRDKIYPFNTIKGTDVNTLIFPSLSAANTAFRFLLAMGAGEVIGPIQIGLKKPVHFIHRDSTVTEIFNLAAIASLDATCLGERC